MEELLVESSKSKVLILGSLARKKMIVTVRTEPELNLAETLIS